MSLIKQEMCNVYSYLSLLNKLEDGTNEGVKIIIRQNVILLEIRLHTMQSLFHPHVEIEDPPAHLLGLLVHDEPQLQNLLEEDDEDMDLDNLSDIELEEVDYQTLLDTFGIGDDTTDSDVIT